MVTDGQGVFFLGGVAETFLVGLAARVATGQREPNVLALEAIRLLIAHAIEAYSEIIGYAQRTGLSCAVTTGSMERKREALQGLDAVIAGLLAESGRDGVGG